MLQRDFRLVAATHKLLREMVANKLFRDDLYYRISTFPIRLPPPHERCEDIPILVESLFARSANHVKCFKGSRKELASALGMSERRLYRRLKVAALD